MPILAAKPPVPALPPAGPRLRVPRLCVAIQAGSAAEMLERAAAALADAKFLEFRLDSLAKPAASLPALKEFLAGRRDVTAIATCRRKPFGGNFVGSLTAEFEVLLKAADAGCQIVDLEVESAEEAKPAALAKFRDDLRAAGAALLVSFHDFTRTKGLEQAAERIEAFQPDFVKVVSTARSLADNLAVLKLIEERSLSAQVVGIAMGEEGLVEPRPWAREPELLSRLLPSLTARKLRPAKSRRRPCASCTASTSLTAPPSCSAWPATPSPTRFRRSCTTPPSASESVNAVLLPLKVRALDDLLTVVRGLPLAGVAVTMPLKQEVLPYLANPVSKNSIPITHRIGACNTLRTGTDGKIVGFNTDVDGVVRPLDRRLKLRGARIAVLGAGGAARAAVFGLVDQGAEVFIVNRTHEKAVALAKEAKAKALKHELFAKSALRCAHQLHALRHGRTQSRPCPSPKTS